MKDLFYEESIDSTNLKMQKVFYQLSNIFLGCFIALFIFSFFFFDLIFSLFTLLCTFLFCLIRRKVYYCVDLSFVDGTTKLVKVIHYKRRKKILFFNNEDIEKIGKITSETFNKLYSKKDYKLIYATPNRSFDDGFYIKVKSSGENYLVLIDCKEEYLENLVAYSGKRILEEDYK